MKTKKLIFFSIFVCAFASLTLGQTISYQSISIVQNSVSYYYSGDTYSYTAPSSVSLGDALASAQARFDYYHKMISNEYFKLKDLQLINKTNQASLSSFKVDALPWVKKMGSTTNVGDSKWANEILKYCCQLYTWPSIKQEIELLNAINLELNRLKREFPGTFHTTDRYKEIGTVLSTLESCSTSEIAKLAWDHGLI
jgi:hypothetical protein